MTAPSTTVARAPSATSDTTTAPDQSIEAAQAARDKKAAMVKAIAKANMLDTEYMVAHCLGANRAAGKDAIGDAGDRFRASITSPMSASNELERTGRAVA